MSEPKYILRGVNGTILNTHTIELALAKAEYWSRQNRPSLILVEREDRPDEPYAIFFCGILYKKAI